MGSSAGGIIALAVSTGIPEYELQKICYKMVDIPKGDRFKSENEIEPALDDFNNSITLDSIKTKLTKILNQYGILQENLVK